MANYTLWIVLWLSAVAIGTLATNTTDSPITAPVSTSAEVPQGPEATAAADNETPSRPNLHLTLSPSTIGGLAAAAAVVILIIVSCLIFVVCLCFYQVGTCCECIVV